MSPPFQLQFSRCRDKGYVSSADPLRSSRLERSYRLNGLEGMARLAVGRYSQVADALGDPRAACGSVFIVRVRHC
jgi:hypothetical protein